MWIVSKHGFFSVTRYPTDKTLYQVRAREKADLVSLIAGIKALPISDKAWKATKIKESTNTDYRYRVVINRAQFTDVLEALEETVDYTNFKSAMGQTPSQKHKVDALHQIWSIMERFQPRRNRAGGNLVGLRNRPSNRTTARLFDDFDRDDRQTASDWFADRDAKEN